MSISLIIIWISLFFYDQLAHFVRLLPFLVYFFAFFALPELYPLPYGITIGGISSNYQHILLLLACFSLFLAPPKLHPIFLGLTLGVLQIIQTTDWFNLYVGLELLLILVFIAGTKTNWKAKHEYFELQILASCLILFGTTRLYATNGNLYISKTTDLFWSIGLLMKLGIWPFHKILRLYTFIEDRQLYLFVVCILSKSLLYCLKFCDPSFARFFLLANLAKSSTQTIRYLMYKVKSNSLTKSESFDLNSLISINLMSSNSLLGFLILQDSYFAPIYLLYFAASQILILAKYERSFYLLASGIPLSPGFFVKILALRELGSDLETTLFLLDSILFCIASNRRIYPTITLFKV